MKILIQEVWGESKILLFYKLPLNAEVADLATTL